MTRLPSSISIFKNNYVNEKRRFLRDIVSLMAKKQQQYDKEKQEYWKNWKI